MRKVDWTATTIRLHVDSDLSDMPNKLPALEYLNASGCTALTALPDMPALKTLNAIGCTALTASYTADRMVSFLTGGGKSLAECCGQEHWQCHEWDNCPTHAAYGASSIDELPEKWRSEAAIFIGLFDAGLLVNPLNHAPAFGGGGKRENVHETTGMGIHCETVRVRG